MAKKRSHICGKLSLISLWYVWPVALLIQLPFGQSNDPLIGIACMVKQICRFQEHVFSCASVTLICDVPVQDHKMRANLVCSDISSPIIILIPNKRPWDKLKILRWHRIVPAP